MINTIFFDIGGVLLNIYPERTVEYLSTFTGLSRQAILDSFPEEAHHKYEKGLLSDEEFFYAAKQELSTANGLTSNKFWNAWSMMVGEKTEVADIINELADDYSIWLLSNTNSYHIINEKRLDLFPEIDGAIYSYEIGARKPEKEIFKKALKISKAEAEHSLFIDDLLENVEAARAMNFKAIQFVSFNDLKQKLINFGIM